MYGNLADSHINLIVDDYENDGFVQLTYRFHSRRTSHPLIQVPNLGSARNPNSGPLFETYSTRQRAINTSFGRDRGVGFMGNEVAIFGPLCQRAYSLLQSAKAAMPNMMLTTEQVDYISIPIIAVS